MLTKAIILNKIVGSNKYVIRIPILESAGDTSISRIDATLAHTPGIIESYKENDVVIISFEEHHPSKPVILGKLYLPEENEEFRGHANLESLSVEKEVNLPKNTKIDGYSLENLDNNLNNFSDKLDKTVSQDIFDIDNFKLKINMTNSGNPRLVKFMSFNYSNCTSETGISVKLSLMSGHGNGSSYRFLEDVILGCTYTGNISVDVYKYCQANVGTFEGVYRFYGDIFYVHDETNKIVDFFVLMGQYSTMKMKPYYRTNASTGGVITQLTESPVYYATGTKVYGSTHLIGQETFSTDEQIVGMWINGKTIYQKTFVVDISSEPTSWSINFSIANLGFDQIWQDMSETFIDGGSMYSLNSYNAPENQQDFFNVYIDHSNKLCYARGYMAGTFSKLYITLRYTKID